MKQSIISILSLSIIVLSACSNSGDLKVTVKDSDTNYKFSAHYDRQKTVTVQQYINATLKPNRIFADHEEKIEKDIKLANGALFHLESSPGDLVIEFDKKENSKAAYENMREMCIGVKEIVAEK